MKLPTLITEWRKAWRFSSVQAALVLAALSMAQADLLPYVQPLVPAKYWPFVSLGMAVAIMVFRLLAQPSLEERREPPQ